MRRLAAAIILLVSLKAPAETLQGAWDKESCGVGDRVSLRIDLGKLEENYYLEGLPGAGTDLQDFRVLEQASERDGGGNVRTTLRLIVFGTGSVHFPVNSVKVLTGGGEKSFDLGIPPLKVEDRVSRTDAAPPPAAPLEIPRPFPLLEVLLAGLGACLLVSGTAYLLARRKKPSRTETEEEALTRSPEEWLVDRIEKKLARGILSIQDYADAGSDIRQFLETRHKVPALELTSTELFDALDGNCPFRLLAFQDLKITFSLVDLVKFAKYFPDEEEEKAFRTVLGIIRGELKQAAQGKEKAA